MLVIDSLLTLTTSFLCLILLFTSQCGTYTIEDEVLQEQKVDLDKKVEMLLLEQMNENFGWDHGDTAKAVIALSLGNDMFFRSGDLRGSLIIKQLQLDLAGVLLKWETEEVSAGRFSLFINALMLTCQDPKAFFDINLITRLWHMPLTSDYEKALVSLTLCNAGIHIQKDRISELNELFQSTEIPGKLDTQAMALMALTCIKDRSQSTYLRSILNESDFWLNCKQKEDGSFGNIYTTAILLQALIGIGDEEKSWRYEPVLRYFAKEYEDPLVRANVLGHFLVLPVLKQRSMANLWQFLNCQHTEGTEDISSKNDLWHIIFNDLDYDNDTESVRPGDSKLPETMRILPAITLSLRYPNDENDQVVNVSTIVFVKGGLPLVEVMRKAAMANEIFQFVENIYSFGTHIDSLAGFRNDHKEKSYWLIYRVLSNETEPALLDKDVSHVNTKDGDHFLFWYKKF